MLEPLGFRGGALRREALDRDSLWATADSAAASAKAEGGAAPPPAASTSLPGGGSGAADAAVEAGIDSITSPTAQVCQRTPGTSCCTSHQHRSFMVLCRCLLSRETVCIVFAVV